MSLQTGKSWEHYVLSIHKECEYSKDKGLSVLFPKFDWSSLGVDVANSDNVTKAFRMQACRAFASEGLPLLCCILCCMKTMW